MAAMTALGIGMLIAGTAMKVTGDIKSGNAARRIGEFNAQVSEGQAVDALRRGATDASTQTAAVRRLIGEQRAAYAGQNVDVSTGTARAVQEDTLQLGLTDAERIRRNAEREAQGFRVDAENYRRGGIAAQRASRWGAGSTVLGSGGSLLLSRYGWEKRREPDRPTPTPDKKG